MSRERTAEQKLRAVGTPRYKRVMEAVKECADKVRSECELEEAAKAFGAPPYSSTASPPPAKAPPRGFIRVVADRLKLPAQPPSVDLQPWLSPEMWMAFVEPQSLLPWPPRPATWDRPRPRRVGPEDFPRKADPAQSRPGPPS